MIYPGGKPRQERTTLGAVQFAVGHWRSGGIGGHGHGSPRGRTKYHIAGTAVDHFVRTQGGSARHHTAPRGVDHLGANGLSGIGADRHATAHPNVCSPRHGSDVNPSCGDCN
jgi:hypothetical protein